MLEGGVSVISNMVIIILGSCGEDIIILRDDAPQGMHLEWHRHRFSLYYQVLK